MVWEEVEGWLKKRNSAALIQGLFSGIQGKEILLTNCLGKKQRLTGWRSRMRGWSPNSSDQKLEGHVLAVQKGMAYGVVLPQGTWESVSGAEGKRGQTWAWVKSPSSFTGLWLRGTVLCQHGRCVLLLTLFLSSMPKAPGRRRDPFSWCAALIPFLSFVKMPLHN